MILELIHELAVYEREPEAVTATAADLLRDGFGAHPKFHVLLAEVVPEPPKPDVPASSPPPVAGFAFYFFNYSTWQGRPGLYLEDLFVRPQYRKQGLGQTLMHALAQIAVANNCGRFQWQVLDWNVDAIGFYEQLGAKILREWLTVRVEGEALHRLAQPGPN